MEGDGRGSYNATSQCHNQLDIVGINTTAIQLYPSFNVADRFPTSSFDGPWHYFACPDVDECANSSSCSLDATCFNLLNPQLPGFPSAESYTCEVCRILFTFVLCTLPKALLAIVQGWLQG
jgi:hypothetical protein